jgi:hypothetical protein
MSYPSSIAQMLGPNIAYKRNPELIVRRQNAMFAGVPLQNLRCLNEVQLNHDFTGLEAFSVSQRYAAGIASGHLELFDHSLRPLNKKASQGTSLSLHPLLDLAAVSTADEVKVLALPSLEVVWSVPCQGVKVKWHYDKPTLGTLSAVALNISDSEGSYAITPTDISDFAFLDNEHIGLLIEKSEVEIWKAGVKQSSVLLHKIGMPSCSSVHSWTNSCLLLSDSKGCLLYVFNYDTKAVLQRLLLTQPYSKQVIVARSEAILLYSQVARRVMVFTPDDTENLSKCTEYFCSLSHCKAALLEESSALKVFLYDEQSVSCAVLHKVLDPADFSGENIDRGLLLQVRSKVIEDCADEVRNLKKLFFGDNSTFLSGVSLELDRKFKKPEEDASSIEADSASDLEDESPDDKANATEQRQTGERGSATVVGITPRLTEHPRGPCEQTEEVKSVPVKAKVNLEETRKETLRTRPVEAVRSDLGQSDGTGPALPTTIQETSPSFEPQVKKPAAAFSSAPLYAQLSSSLSPADLQSQLQAMQQAVERQGNLIKLLLKPREAPPEPRIGPSATTGYYLYLQNQLTSLLANSSFNEALSLALQHPASVLVATLNQMNPHALGASGHLHPYLLHLLFSRLSQDEGTQVADDYEDWVEMCYSHLT